MSSLLSKASYSSVFKVVYNEPLVHMEMLAVEWMEKLDVHVAINKQWNSILKRHSKCTCFH